MEMTDILKKHFEGIETKFGPLPDKVAEAIARLNELEQKSALGGHGGYAPETKTWGSQVADQMPAIEEFKNRSGMGRLSFDLKTTITSTTADPLVVPQRDNLLPLARRALRVRDLLNVVPVTSGSVEYPRHTATTNAAATVAEAALKPESAITFDLVTVPIRTFAHFLPASRQILDDAPQLRAFIDSELLYGLAFVEDNQLLNGAGTGTDLNGIYTQATTFAAGTLIISAPTKIDVLLAAILQNQLANLPVTGIVLHPSDWTSIVATKDTTGGYIIGNPQDVTTPNLFGVPVALSLAMTAGTFLVGDFQGSATLYDRWSPRVEISTEHSDFFVRNMVAILAEERIGLGVKRATGFTKGTFSTAITDLTS
jgi:HK97 family phage major capsid protein